MLRYGVYGSNEKYNRFIYGGRVFPFAVRVVLRNKTNTESILIDAQAKIHEGVRGTKYGQKQYNTFLLIARRTTPQLVSVEWEYNRIGGYGLASIGIKIPHESSDGVEEGMDVRIECRAKDSFRYELWYRGEVISRRKTLGNPDFISITAIGLSSQLNFIPDGLDEITFNNTDTGSIVAAIIDSFVVNEKDIVRTQSKTLIDITNYTLQETPLIFTDTAMSAIRTLAELTGDIEWGVDINNEIFFKTQKADIKFDFYIKTTGGISQDEDFSRIINKYKLVGGDGTEFTRGDAVSQTSFGVRSQTIQNAAIKDQTVADKYIDAFLIQTKDPLVTFEMSLLNIRTRIEENIPIGRVRVRNIENSGESVFYQIENITYRLSGGDGLTANITGGKIKDDISAIIQDLEDKINQIINS